MSTAVVVYSVASGPLRAAFGSKSEPLKLKLRLGKDSKSVALRALIDGVPTSEDASTVLYAFERLCAHFGRQLPNASFSATRLGSLERIDAALKNAGMPFSVLTLIYGGAPVPLPQADDFPSVGCIDESSVRATAELIAKNGLSAEDPELDGALFDVSEWTEVAAARGDMLVGFSY
jgi:hypothetical protein